MLAKQLSCDSDFPVQQSALFDHEVERCGIARAQTWQVPLLTALLQTLFFEAHAVSRRVIEDEHIESAALQLVAPERLERIRWPR